MSDGRIRYSFAARLSAGEANVFMRAASWEIVAEHGSCSGPRLDRKKVKGEKNLSRALVRSALGRSED
jgi:hypothetical protein